MIGYDEYKAGVELLNRWARAYYSDDTPLASDEEYDKLYSLVVKFEERNPTLKSPHSVTQKIGGAVSEGFEKSAHIAQMWSMEDIFDESELLEWIQRGQKENFEFFVEPKFDGASLNLLYDDGVLIKATTRGDGKIGEDVTQNARVIPSIPLSIEYKGLVEIRGEVVISKGDFDKINDERALNGETVFANPRNTAAGSLRQLDSGVVARRKLLFLPWGVGENSLGFSTHDKIMEFVRNLGFKKDEFIKPSLSAKELQAAYNELLSKRNEKDILMDGMVIRVNNLEICQSLGYTVKFPKFMVAYKFPPVEKVTKLVGITLQVGRSGVVTPVGVLEPVNIDGVVVKSASLHNFDEIDRLNLMQNDYVNVIRSGDVIPKITAVYKDRRVGDERALSRPTHCPECKSELFSEDVFLRCLNLSCRARILGSIIYFSSKSCMNIEGLAEGIIAQLIEANLLKDVSDIYRLKFDDLIVLEGFKEKKTLNLLNAITASKNISLDRFIASLGIEHIGNVASSKIAKAFGNSWIDAKFEQLSLLDGFGEIMARSVVEFCEVNRDKIRDLLEFITPVVKLKETTKNLFSGKTVVITGTLSRSRDEFKEELLGFGAKISSSVSKKTDFILAGKEAGSKLENGLKLGVKIISEEEFDSMKRGTFES